MVAIKGKAKHRHRFFSIIELVIVMGLVVALGSMVAPTVDRMNSTAKEQSCRANLLNVHQGIVLYIEDNDTMMMGPVWGAQRPHLRHPRGWKYSHFAKYLEPYMEFFEKMGDDGATYNEAFICPANAALPMQGREAIHHRSHYRTTTDDRVRRNPLWLYGRPGGRTRSVIPPNSYFSVPTPSKTELLVDSDILNTHWLERIRSDYSEVPVHDGAFRNNLFFDGNVKAVEYVP